MICCPDSNTNRLYVQKRSLSVYLFSHQLKAGITSNNWNLIEQPQFRCAFLAECELKSVFTSNSLFKTLYHWEKKECRITKKRDRMASFTERRSCQISWQCVLLSQHTVQSLSLYNFPKGNFCCAAAHRVHRLLPPRPWDEQYQIHFAKSICIIFKDV